MQYLIVMKPSIYMMIFTRSSIWWNFILSESNQVKNLFSFYDSSYMCICISIYVDTIIDIVTIIQRISIDTSSIITDITAWRQNKRPRCHTHSYCNFSIERWRGIIWRGYFIQQRGGGVFGGGLTRAKNKCV